MQKHHLYPLRGSICGKIDKGVGEEGTGRKPRVLEENVARK